MASIALEREAARQVATAATARAFFAANLAAFQVAAANLRFAWELAEGHGVEVVANYNDKTNLPIGYSTIPPLPSFHELEAIIASWEA